MPSVDSQVSTQRTFTCAMPAATILSMKTSPRSLPRGTTTLPSSSTASSASTRAYTPVSTCVSLTSEPSGCVIATGIMTPRSVPQSSSRMITSWETSTSRRVR